MPDRAKGREYPWEVRDADADALRSAMSHYPTGVTVVTSGREEKVEGMTANAVISVSLDPLLFLKRSVPSLSSNTYRAHVVIALDTSQRMQVDADRNYYDPYDYAVGNLWDSTLGVNGAASKYRRKYVGMQQTGSGSPKRC